MGERINEILTDILEQLFQKKSMKHDCHYKEGYGALFVPEGYGLHPNYVLMHIDETQLVMLAMTNGKITIH